MAMTFSVARADLTMTSCSSQMQADDMCYATALPAAQSDGARKGGVCCEFLLNTTPVLIGPKAQIHRFMTRQAVHTGLVVPAPFRPPRA
ncbi:hypothetical protein H4P12_07135 [Paracoccus sp. 11-3]|uniref:Uncharacterized protein n=1 Tax=Paracoccus amoyensis TaxID=2760093 RepID=A0A926JCK9_9RHOB|nr:hypothetical protein [Paracoccus amoyensis]